ncbi:PLP-dependent aminotransferase family protein [Photobacterium profundum]|uniref:MocR-like pyridoxine biosynthesis transcription factor PdxR n=1 Tax=Photobacterium profundum TaxID=74109 RepID=UPI003D0DDDBB
MPESSLLNTPMNVSSVSQPIDTGDLNLSRFSLANKKLSRQEALFHAIQEKIIEGLWPKGGKLPSTRKLAVELHVSRNTVIFAYEQLAAEGYINSKKGSGFYVAVKLPEQYLFKSGETSTIAVDKIAPLCVNPLNMNSAFAPGIPDLSAFPHAKWQRFLQRHTSRNGLLGNQSIQGELSLREALSDYLASSRSVRCNPERIIITSGAQQALSIAVMAALGRDSAVLMEDPGYIQMRKVLQLFGIPIENVKVHEHQGLDLDAVLKSKAQALYITPSNQYPMGTTLNTEQRLQLIEWASQSNRWLIEDDYDSEFQFAHRPYTSLQGLAGQMGKDGHVLYIGSFSKVMFNGLRLGYLVAPEHLVERCLTIKDALSGDSPTHTQAALADFIIEGELLRHIRKMRRLYQAKHQTLVAAITRTFSGRLEVISQAAGLHITVKWHGGISEQDWCARAQSIGIIIRPLTFYESDRDNNDTNGTESREWRSVVMGFGNIALTDIEPTIAQLADVFD